MALQKVGANNCTMLNVLNDVLNVMLLSAKIIDNQ